MEKPEHGSDVVLIDEIELHLHPKWQRMVIPALLRTFPNCQFIITTHSPQVLGEVKGGDRCLMLRFRRSDFVGGEGRSRSIIHHLTLAKNWRLASMYSCAVAVLLIQT